MMNKTDIEYLDYTWNVTHGCSPISPGCDNCWAKATAKRLAGMGAWGYPKENPFAVTCCPWKLDEPLKVKKPSRIGVSFMGDLFHEDVPFTFVSKIFDTISSCSRHEFLILTKRPERMKEYCVEATVLGGLYRPNVMPNIWLGVTAENQEQADKRIPILLQIPAAKRFVSIEPMLEAVDLTRLNVSRLPGCNRYTANVLDSRTNPVLEKPYKHLDWVIVGAESGLRKRYCDPYDMIKIVNQCKEADVPVFVKQIHLLPGSIGDMNHFYLSKNVAIWPEDLRVREYPE